MAELLKVRPSEAVSAIRSQVYHPSQWSLLQHDLLSLTRYGMGAGIIPAEDPAEWTDINFRREDPDLINVLLKRGDRAIGFSVAYRQPNPRRAFVGHTLILPPYQQQGFVGTLMNGMESEMKRRGIQEMEEYAVNGYAGSISKHYAGRIMETGPMSPSCTYFLIRL